MHILYTYVNAQMHMHVCQCKSALLRWRRPELISAANGRLPQFTPLITREAPEGRLEGEGGTKAPENGGGTDTCKMKTYRKHALWLMPPPREVQKSLHTHVITSHVAKTLARTRHRATSQEP